MNAFRNQKLFFAITAFCTLLVLYMTLDGNALSRAQKKLSKTLPYFSGDKEISSGVYSFNDTYQKALLLAHPKRVIRIIHQSWKVEKLPSERMEKWAASWRSCYPNWIYMLWTDADNRRLVAERYPWFLERYDSLPRNIMRVDVVRYLYMHTFGGIYADLDAECLRPFEHLLNSSIVLGAMDGNWVLNIKPGHIQNSFMYSQPGHSFWIELVNNVLMQKQFGGVEGSTGPLMLIRVLKEYQKRGLTDIQIYPGVYFNPFSWIQNKNKDCVIQGRMTEEQEKRCRNSFLKTSYVLQYHTKTWGGGRAR